VISEATKNEFELKLYFTRRCAKFLFGSNLWLVSIFPCSS